MIPYPNQLQWSRWIPWGKNHRPTDLGDVRIQAEYININGDHQNDKTDNYDRHPSFHIWGVEDQPHVVTIAYRMLEQPHSNRYPKHADPTKGQIHNGTCNITACDRSQAVFWNTMTYGLYCVQCAQAINWRNTLCHLVDEKPDLETMDEWHHRDMGKIR